MPVLLSKFIHLHKNVRLFESTYIFTYDFMSKYTFLRTCLCILYSHYITKQLILTILDTLVSGLHFQIASLTLVITLKKPVERINTIA